VKLEASIADLTLEVDIRREGERVFATVDGRPYELIVQSARPGLYLIISEGMVFECRVDGGQKAAEASDVFVGTDHFPITLTDPKRLRSAHSAAGHAEEAARIIAPMPGKIVRILVEPGASVEAGAGIVVVEAMKMQNEMKSPKAGTVISLNVEVGATVNGGDVLAVIE
jgi:biotin carboxyl carrier protein